LSGMPISPYLHSLREIVGQRQLLLPGVTAVVFDDAGRLLLGRRVDDGTWALIAGSMDPGEQPAETAVREVYEETGVHVVPERITSVLTQPPNTYPNGDKTEYAEYLSEALRLLKPGGIVAFDNALWHDRVADPAQRDAETVAIRELGRTVREHESLLPVLLPVGDGLLVAKKVWTPEG